MSLHSTKSKSLFADRVADVGEQPQSGSRLQQEAASALSSRGGNDAFGARISPADASSQIAKGNEIVVDSQTARAAEGGIRGQNFNDEQKVAMLKDFPTPELFENLVDTNQDEAFRLADKDHRFVHMAMESENPAFRDRVSNSRYGVPAA